MMNDKLKKADLFPLGAHPSARQIEWLGREKSIFFHFGINTFTDREWGGGTEDISVFNPDSLDCRQWIRTIKQAGFQAAVLTAKHHDGFCLWPTQYTDFSIRNTPYKNGKGDIVREFTDACEEYGVKAGIYLSPWDRNSKLWGTDAYNDFYAAQLKELMTNYGKIWECWWDGAGSDKAYYDWGRWAYIVHTLQPDCAIYGSHGLRYADCRWVGNENGIAGEPCWSEIEPTGANEEAVVKLNHGDKYGSRFIPAEADVSIRPGWFYHEFQDRYVKSAPQLLDLWFHSNGKNASMLLNLPPNRHGLISEVDADALLAFGNALKQTFAVNLALGSVITCSSERKGCSVYNILSDERDCLYAAEDEDTTPLIRIRLKKPQRANCFSLSEAVELGHRVRNFTVTMHTADGSKIIRQAECIGYRYATLFDEADITAVDIAITQADAAPVITHFGLYNCGMTTEDCRIAYQSTDNLMLMPSAEVHYSENEIIMDLGGTFPYNTVTFESGTIIKYELYAFNGCSYEKIADGSVLSPKETVVFKPIEYSYKLKLTVTEGRVDRNAVEVRYVAENVNRTDS